MTFNETISKYQSYILLLTIFLFIPFFIYTALNEYFVAFTTEIIVLALFILSYFLVSKGKNIPGYVISLVTFVFNACSGIYFFGTDFGTQYFLLVINVFYAGNRRSSKGINLFVVLGIFTIYLFFTIYYSIHPSLYQMQEGHLEFFKQVNIVVAFSYLSLSFYIYSVLLEKTENELKLTHNQVVKMAHTDTLTDLPNRRSIEDELSLIIPCTNDGCKGLSIALADIDYFKKINDTYGHKVGDEVLQVLSERFSKIVRSNDFLGRWGGEEFIFILKNTHHNMAFETVERIRMSAQSEPIKTSGGLLDITLTFGLTNCKSTDTEESIFTRVDNNLYIGKEKGRNVTITDIKTI